MIVPSGNGSFPSLKALIATSLPRTARKSLSLPSSWVTEIKLQLRYPGGILTPKIGAASPSACPDAGAMETTSPASATTATIKRAIRFIGFLLPISVVNRCLSGHQQSKIFSRVPRRVGAGRLWDGCRHDKLLLLRALFVPPDRQGRVEACFVP